MTVAAYVAVGSNIQPEINVPAALEKLMCSVRVTASSTFYRTAALREQATGEDARGTTNVSFVDPEFRNGVWKIETDLGARALKFAVLRPIEDELGRTRTADAYAPRTIDLDLLVYGDTAVDEPRLRVPDPDIRSRPFLAVPLLELSPGLVLADTGERLAGLPVADAGPRLVPDRVLTDLLRERIKR